MNEESTIAIWSQMSEFNQGVLTMALIIVVVVLVVKCIDVFWFKSGKRAKGIAIPDEKGQIFISTSAIQDLVSREIVKFKSLEHSRVHLLKNRGKGFVISFNVNFNPVGDESLQQVLSDARSAVLNRLSTVFGINNIDKIDISVKRSSDEDV